MNSPIMYENRAMPGSVSSNSKLENLKGISTKWFSKKGPTSNIDTASSISSTNTSPVDGIPTLRSQNDDHSPFSSRNSALSYRPPLTPPNAYPSSPHLQKSPGQVFSGMSLSPSNASSLCTAASSLGSTTSLNGFSDCCFCDIPLGYILGSEDIVELSCTHLAHFECLLRLSLVLNKNRVPFKQPRLPPCGVCDEGSSFVDENLGFKFSETIRDLVSKSFTSPSMVTSAEETSPPVGTTVSAATCASAAQEEVTPIIATKRIIQSAKSCRCQMASCVGATCGVEFSAQLSKALPTSGPAKTQCLINITVPENVFYNNGYTRTPSDDVQVYSQISKLKRLSFKGVSLNRVDMSQLRLVNNYKVSSDLRNWSTCTLYLMADSLILTSNNDAQVKAVIELKSHLASAKIFGRDLVPHIELVVKSIQKSKLYFICDEIEPLEALCAALHNYQLTFPVVSNSLASTIPANLGQVLYSTPLNVVLCVEQPESPLIANACVESLATLRKRMGPLDRLSLVIYGSSNIRSFDFQPSASSSWCKIEDTLRKSVSSKTASTSSLDKCLETAEELLRNLRIERSLACVIIVNSSPPAMASPISPGFIYSSTPIHTIGIDDQCDFTTLSKLSADLGGISISCDPQNLAQKVEALYKHTRSRTHKNVEMRLVPGEGVGISKVYGANMVEAFDRFGEKSYAKNEDIATNVEDQPQIISLGSLYEGTTCSFILDLEIQECTSLNENQVLQTILYSRTPQSISHHRCTATNIVRANDSTPASATDLIMRQASLDACEFACDLASLLMGKQHKQAFKETQSERGQFVKRHTATDNEADPYLVQSLTKLDEFFDEFSDKLFQPRAQLTGELFNFVWTNFKKNLI